MKETGFKKSFQEFIQNNLVQEIYAIKMMGNGNSGVPDIEMSVKGLFIGCELKQANGWQQALTKLSEKQKYHRVKILKSGGCFIVVGSSRERNKHYVVIEKLGNRTQMLLVRNIGEFVDTLLKYAGGIMSNLYLTDNVNEAYEMLTSTTAGPNVRKNILLEVPNGTLWLKKTSDGFIHVSFHRATEEQLIGAQLVSATLPQELEKLQEFVDSINKP